MFYKSVYEIEYEVGPEIVQKMDMMFFFHVISCSELEEDQNQKTDIKNNTCHIDDAIKMR